MPRKGRGIALAAALALSACGPGGGTRLVGSAAFTQLHMLDAMHGWGLTGAAVATTADGGATWTPQQLPPSDADLLTAGFTSFPSPSAAWLCQAGSARRPGPQQAFGDNIFQRYPPSRCLVTADGGSTWAAHDIPGTDTGTVDKRNRDTDDLVDIAAVDSRTALGVVRSERDHAGGGQESEHLVDLRVVRTTDAGRTWTTVLERTPETDGSPDSLGAPRIELFAGTGWMVDWIPGVLERTADDGATWRPVPLPESLGASWSARRARLGMPSAGAIPAVAVPVITEGVAGGPETVALANSEDDGATWWVTSSQTCRSSFCTAWDAPDPPDRVIGDGASLLVTHDGGIDWSRGSLPPAFSQIGSVQMLGPRDGWAVGYAPGQGSKPTGGEPLRTTDGGLTWRPIQG